MRANQDNPEVNQLPPGIDESELGSAIEISGYPLQGIVAKMLGNQFNVTEEWGYIDAETKEHRSLDLFAGRALAAADTGGVHPRVALLIECKRSRHPYVFFSKHGKSERPRFSSCRRDARRGDCIKGDWH